MYKIKWNCIIKNKTSYDRKPTTVYYIRDSYKEKLIGYGPRPTECDELYTRSISRAYTKLNEIRREYIQRWVADIRTKRINKEIKKL